MLPRGNPEMPVAAGANAVLLENRITGQTAVTAGTGDIEVVGLKRVEIVVIVE